MDIIQPKWSMPTLREELEDFLKTYRVSTNDIISITVSNNKQTYLVSTDMFLKILEEGFYIERIDADIVIRGVGWYVINLDPDENEDVWYFVQDGINESVLPLTDYNLLGRLMFTDRWEDE